MTAAAAALADALTDPSADCWVDGLADLLAPDSAPILGPDLTIAHAASHRERLLAILAGQPGNLCLNLGDVSDIDSSGVQLLLATRLSLAQQGRALRLAPCSTAVREALGTFGLDTLLGDGAGHDNHARTAG